MKSGNASDALLWLAVSVFVESGELGIGLGRSTYSPLHHSGKAGREKCMPFACRGPSTCSSIVLAEVKNGSRTSENIYLLVPVENSMSVNKGLTADAWPRQSAP